MAYRLGEYVTYGELYTTSHYGVFGFLVLRTEEEEAGGEHTFVRLELTGDPDPDLQGLHLCFEPEEGAEVKYFRKAEHAGLQLRQYGATGTMTAQGWVRTLPCPPEEFMARARLGEPPPTTWKNRLYLEWYGPNGRTVVELAGPMVEVCTREADDDDELDTGDWEPLPNGEPMPESERGDDVEDDFQITAVNAAGEMETITGTDFRLGETGDFERVLGWEQGEDPFAEGAYADEEFLAEPSPPDRHTGEPGGRPWLKALCGTDTLPRPDELDETAVEVQLKTLLGRLALFGVALHVCDHCTPRDAYRLLLNKILPELSRGAPDATGAEIRAIMTAEYCRFCAAEACTDFGQAIWN